MGRHRKYSVKLLERAAKVVAESGRPIAPVAAEFKVPAETLRRFIRAAEQEKPSNPEPDGQLSVTEAVKLNIEDLSQSKREVADSPEAALALSLAARIDDPNNKAAGVSMAAGRLLDALTALRALAPAKAKGTPLDEIKERRDRRVAGLPAATDSVPPTRRRRTS